MMEAFKVASVDRCVRSFSYHVMFTQIQIVLAGSQSTEDFVSDIVYHNVTACD